MDVAGLVEALRRDGRLLATAAGGAGLDAPVPTCPEWTVRDLVRHTGGVHRWAASHVRDRRQEMWGADLVDVVGSWPDDRDLLEWFRAGHHDLVDVLAAADPDLRCATFLRAPSPLAMWARRQAHETAIHRVDAERAAGRPAPGPFPPEFAADGIDELLSCFVTRPKVRLRSERPRTLAVTASDVSRGWRLTIQADGVTTNETEPDAKADCQLRAPAAHLYLSLWNRRGPDGIDVDGDRGVLDLFLDRVKIRWA